SEKDLADVGGMAARIEGQEDLARGSFRSRHGRLRIRGLAQFPSQGQPETTRKEQCARGGDCWHGWFSVLAWRPLALSTAPNSGLPAHVENESRKPEGLWSVNDTHHAPVALLRQLEEEFDRELLEMAMACVRLRVEAHTWDAFRFTALEGLSRAEAA